MSETKETPLCDTCGTEPLMKDAYCRHCGAKRKIELPSFSLPAINFEARIFKILSFYLCSIGLVLYLSIIDWGLDPSILIIADIGVIGLTLIYTVDNRKEMKGLYSIQKIEIGPLVALVFCMVLGAFAVDFLGEMLNLWLTGEGVGLEDLFETQPEDEPQDFYNIFFICLVPAIFEEMAFRGFIYNHMLKMGNHEAAMVLSSVLFAMAHLSLISILWLFPLGLLFAWYRMKYNILWYGMIGHFIYNLTMVYWVGV